jgi:hypothetical protein
LVVVVVVETHQELVDQLARAGARAELQTLLLHRPDLMGQVAVAVAVALNYTQVLVAGLAELQFTDNRK